MNAILKNAEKITHQNKFCRISVITNITFDPYLTQFLKLNFLKSDIFADVQIIRMENYLNEVDKIQNSDIVVAILNFECQYPNWYHCILSGSLTSDQFRSCAVENCMQMYQAIKKIVSCPIVWFGYEIEDFYRTSVCGSISVETNIIDDINANVCGYLNENDSHIDIRHLIAEVGISYTYDNKSKYRWNAPYSQLMIQAISNEIYKQYLIQMGITMKCLVLDCDGVLWGGILSEVGIEQIKLGSDGWGRPYQDFQRFLLTLYYHGVILAICSKTTYRMS